MDLKSCYDAMGANYDDVIRRLVTEERVIKFLSKILTDKSYSNLCAALEQQDYKEAFRAAHSMKGICMNLGLTVLQKSSSALTENLREGSPDQDTGRLFEQLKSDYRNTRTAIESLLGL